MWTRLELKMRAKQALRTNYWACVGAGLILTIVTYGMGTSGAANGAHSSGAVNGDYIGGSSTEADGQFAFITLLLGMIGLTLGIVILLFNIFVGSVVTVGAKRFFVQNQNESARVGTVFSVFKSGHYGNVVITMFLMNLFIVLWSFLLIIPGVIKSYEYYMVPYILAENPGMNRAEAFAISKRMMKGQKMSTFVLSLSFIGWMLLSVITCGLATVFYVTPYMEATFAELYTVSRVKAFNEGYIR